MAIFICFLWSSFLATIGQADMTSWSGVMR